MTRGVGCHTPNCKARLHLHCFSKFRRSRKTCPTCSAEWPQNAKDKPLLAVGEDAAKAGDDQGRRSRRDDADSEPEEDEAEDEEEAEVQDTPPKRRTKGKKAAREDSMDVDEEEDEPVVKPEPSQTQGKGRLRRSTRH